MGVNVYETWGNQQTFGINFSFTGFDTTAYGIDNRAIDTDISDAARCSRTIYQVGVTNNQIVLGLPPKDDRNFLSTELFRSDSTLERHHRPAMR